MRATHSTGTCSGSVESGGSWEATTIGFNFQQSFDGVMKVNEKQPFADWLQGSKSRDSTWFLGNPCAVGLDLSEGT